MTYDWKKIFENKKNKELYEIYSGNSMLPKETVEYARQELERRNFDFNDIDNNKSAWKLSELIIEAERAEQVLKENQIKIIPYKILYFLIPAILFVYIFLLKFLDINLSIYFPIIMTGLTIWYVTFTNRIYSKQREEQNDRLKRINEIKEKLEKNVSIEKLEYVNEDIVRNFNENNKNKKILIWILYVFILLILLIKIFGIFE